VVLQGICLGYPRLLFGLVGLVFVWEAASRFLIDAINFDL